MRDVWNVKFRDKDNRVTLTYKNHTNVPNGNHVLSIPVYNDQLLFTQHKIRGIEFPGGKVEKVKRLQKQFKNCMKKQERLLEVVITLHNTK